MAGDFIILATVMVMIYALQQFGYSRMIVFGTIFLSFFSEMVLGYVYFYNRQMRRDADQLDRFTDDRIQALKIRKKMVEADDILKIRDKATHPPLNKELIIRESGKPVYDFIKDHIDIEHVNSLLVSTTTVFNIDNQPDDYFNAFVNLKKINDIQRINKFFEAVNRKLPAGGIFIGCVLTNRLVYQRIMEKYPPIINHLYYLFYFTWKRVMPKLPVAKKVYFFFTRGRHRAISKAETFGRLYSCGFELIDDGFISGFRFFAARKIQEPAFDYHPTYGPLVRLKRVGKNGKIIYVFKMRTMHPYSEYLQQYVYDKHDLGKGGKFKDDFRVNALGRFMRRFWIDELPMFINLVRGDLKIVGVRPLSKHYFDLYSEELQQKRIKTRPGLIPPYYADMPGTLEEIQESEIRYLDAHLKHPFLTDWRYFWKASYNIVFKKARSK